MIDVGLSWTEIFARLGLKSLRRGRGECPFCGSRTGFSVSEERSLFHCFACSAGGDKITFVELMTNSSFVEALGWFGLDPSIPQSMDPVMVRQRLAERGLKVWAAQLGRRLRDEYRHRARIRDCALERLRDDREDCLGWTLLSVAYAAGIPLDELEAWLDRIDIGRPPDQLAAYAEAMR